MFFYLATVFIILPIAVNANRNSNPADSCYTDGDSKNCTSYIRTRWNLSLEQLEMDRNRIRQLIQAGKIQHNAQAIPAPVDHVTLFCYAKGQQVPFDGICVPCPINCASSEFDKDVCGFFCNLSRVQPTSAIQTTPTPTSDRLEISRVAFNTSNATLSNRSTNITRVDTTASTDHLYDHLMCAGIIAVLVIIIMGLMVIVMVGGCFLYRYRKRLQNQNEASANGGVAFMWFICVRFSLYFLRFLFSCADAEMGLLSARPPEIGNGLRCEPQGM